MDTVVQKNDTVLMTEKNLHICQSVTNMHAHALPPPPTACPVQCQSIVTREPLVNGELQLCRMTVDLSLRRSVLQGAGVDKGYSQMQL